MHRIGWTLLLLALGAAACGDDDGGSLPGPQESGEEPGVTAPFTVVAHAIQDERSYVAGFVPGRQGTPCLFATAEPETTLGYDDVVAGEDPGPTIYKHAINVGDGAASGCSEMPVPDGATLDADSNQIEWRIAATPDATVTYRVAGPGDRQLGVHTYEAEALDDGDATHRILLTEKDIPGLAERSGPWIVEVSVDGEPGLIRFDLQLLGGPVRWTAVDVWEPPFVDPRRSRLTGSGGVERDLLSGTAANVVIAAFDLYNPTTVPVAVSLPRDLGEVRLEGTFEQRTRNLFDGAVSGSVACADDDIVYDGSLPGCNAPIPKQGAPVTKLIDEPAIHAAEAYADGVLLEDEWVVAPAASIRVYLVRRPLTFLSQGKLDSGGSFTAGNWSGRLQGYRIRWGRKADQSAIALPKTDRWTYLHWLHAFALVVEADVPLSVALPGEEPRSLGSSAPLELRFSHSSSEDQAPQ